MTFAIAALAAVLAHADAAAQSDAAAVKDKLQLCATCHGATGNSADPKYPVLAGQTARYLYLQLRDFKESRRHHDPQMEKDLSRENMLALADFYSKQRKVPNGFKADGAKVAAGRRKSDEVLCPMCHHGDFVGQNEVPRVAGQHYAYVKKQLQDFKARRRTNDAGNMTSVAGTLSDDDIENLAQFIANLD